ncbi:hypothetical protein BRADI_5g24766v3 [Brachypodium distachyon]|uniref:Uncharacterized protein n=1 Tax=Brachypodium distachyon TaxID=15368 RepID=A0A2K2CJ72_BRADI|nr:hypothetical protein BRADI_5g24766v3 [Brachypodium distachyon]PNT62055.1 hypothetical protein BRADI_5g24766v3 [Brachypodium distachyon]
MKLAISCSPSPSTTTRRQHRGGWSSLTAAARRRQQQHDVDTMVDGARRLLQPTTAPAGPIINPSPSSHQRQVAIKLGRGRVHRQARHQGPWQMELVIMLSGLAGVQSLSRRVKTTRCCAHCFAVQPRREGMPTPMMTAVSTRRPTEGVIAGCANHADKCACRF